MKNIVILTSVLALAACGGGSGGGGVQPGTAADILGNGVISDRAADSNSKITSMTSAIVVASDGSSSAIRSGSVNYMGKIYNIYDLSDVKFRIAEDPEMGNFEFKVDNEGRIAKITENLGDASSTINRIGETQRFNGPMFEYVLDGDDGEVLWREADDNTKTMADLNAIATSKGFSGGHWNRIDEILDISTEGNGLKFSDFGKFQPVYRSKHKNLNEEMLTAIRDAEPHIKSYLDANDSDGLIDYLQTNHSELLGLDGHGDPDLHGGDHHYNTADERENEFENSMDYQLFAGGYAIKNGQLVETLTPTEGMRFTGKAIGRVYASIQTGDGYENRAARLNAYGVPYYIEDGEHHKTYYVGDITYDEAHVPDDIQAIALSVEDAGHDMAQYYTTNNATLNVNNGTATLTMPFAAQGFYNVVATKTGNADAVVSFNNPATGLPTYLAKDTDVNSVNQHDNFGYYGIDVPSEAAGTIQYKTKKVLDGPTNNPTAWRDWEFQAAYGMKKN